jgi:ribulose 1,5-bisphosphate synthetase/thiazole synthase
MDLTNIKHVMINNQTMDIDGEVTSLDKIKEAAVEIDPSLANADPVVSGDTVSFVRRAGTKGADQIKKAVYNNQSVNINPEIQDNPVEIKAALERIYPEIANYDYVVSGDTMSFVKRAGTKG